MSDAQDLLPQQHDSDLPNTTLWQPRKKAQDTLQTAFLRRCTAAEKLIMLRAGIEREMNVDNYDSGPGVEDIVREEFRGLLPTRYSIRPGVVNDRHGLTAGDFDLIIFNEHWFPAVKAGPTLASRRFHFPVEGIYAAIEIKQGLDEKVLDKAMEKLVTCHRLHRPATHAYRVTENREGADCTHGLTNPLYSAIIATDVRPGADFQALVKRFYDINRTLKRLEMVRSLCVLGIGTVTWGFHSNGELRPALFMNSDLYHPIVPVLHRMPDVGSALYRLVSDVLLHLYHSILGPEDIAGAYGPFTQGASAPTSMDVRIDPDPEWLEGLSRICSNDEASTGGPPRHYEWDPFSAAADE